MKYSVLGFNQERIVNYSVEGVKCDLTDLLLLNYIIYAQANPKMIHILDDDNKPCVWLQHEHILEDLPILNITAGTLRNRLTKLRKMNLITSKTVADNSKQGTMTYYRITSFLNDMIFETTSFQNDMIDESHHSKMTSYNTQKDNKKVNKNSSNEELQPNDFLGSAKKKPAKQNLYSRCVSVVDSFLDSLDVREDKKKLRELLLEYLTFRLSVKDKPLYENMWKGMIKKLPTIANKNKLSEIVQQSIERGYLSFYPISKPAYAGRDKFSEGSKGLRSDSYTQEELDRIMREAEEREARGEQGIF